MVEIIYNFCMTPLYTVFGNSPYQNSFDFLKNFLQLPAPMAEKRIKWEKGFTVREKDDIINSQIIYWR